MRQHANCLVKPVTEKTYLRFSFWEIVNGCLVITVTENATMLWSITLTGSEDLDQDSKDAVFHQLAERYNWLETKKEKMDCLIEIESIILPRLSIKAMHRKSLIRKLRSTSVKELKQQRGRKPKYNDFDKYHLVQVWKLSGYPCSKRLKSILEEWLNDYNCSNEIKLKLKSMSAAQMDIYLKTPRIEHQRKVNCGTVPAKNHIKRLIRLRDPSVRYSDPGHIESDTVLHCGHFIWGIYAHTVSVTDLATGWTSGKGTFGKNAELVVGAIKTLQEKLPFKMLSLFFDNGIEYVNHLLVQEFKVIGAYRD